MSTDDLIDGVLAEGKEQKEEILRLRSEISSIEYMFIGTGFEAAIPSDSVRELLLQYLMSEERRELLNAIDVAKHQILILHEKFQETDSGNTTIVKLDALLSKHKQNKVED